MRRFVVVCLVLLAAACLAAPAYSMSGNVPMPSDYGTSSLTFNPTSHGSAAPAMPAIVFFATAGLGGLALRWFLRWDRSQLVPCRIYCRQLLVQILNLFNV